MANTIQTRQAHDAPAKGHSSTVDSKGQGGGCNYPETFEQKRNRLQFIKPQPQLSTIDTYFPRSSGQEDLAYLFDFDPPLNPLASKKSMLSKEPSFGLNDWNPLGFQPLSPPDTAVYPSDSWRTFNTHQQPHNILTQIDPARARTQYGQTTPPDDAHFPSLESELLMQEQDDNAFFLHTPSDSDEKHKQLAGTSEPGAPPPKRVRKTGGRGSKTVSLDPNDPEDCRRSKFLERNRIAASKCRQKKKEWTNNLETRARELQKYNTSLRHMVDSCKEELLFLKGEVLRHNACGNMDIQEYLQHGSQSFHGLPDTIIKRETSPVCTAPSTPGSVSSRHGCPGISEQLSRPQTPAEAPSRRSSVSDKTLERLLTSQFAHDTSEKGIAQHIAR